MTTEKHEVFLRLKAIELLAYWEGRLVTNRLMAWFGISRQQASADIKRYLENHNPGSLAHDPSVKAYVPQPGFRPVLTANHINEYLDLVSGMASDSLATNLDVDSNLTVIQFPDRALQSETVRKVITACRSQHSIKIQYASMKNPTPSERIISPHTLVHTGFRWHVRAYSHNKQQFNDFVLSRINGTPQPTPEDAPPLEEDTLWQEIITLTLIPNNILNDKQRHLVAKDYGMSDNQLQIHVRKALIDYTLRRYRAAITAEDASDKSQPLIQLLDSDREKVKPYLFDAGVNK